jgi:hypothetical protein
MVVGVLLRSAVPALAILLLLLLARGATVDSRCNSNSSSLVRRLHHSAWNIHSRKYSSALLLLPVPLPQTIQEHYSHHVAKRGDVSTVADNPIADWNGTGWLVGNDKIDAATVIPGSQVVPVPEGSIMGLSSSVGKNGYWITLDKKLTFKTDDTSTLFHTATPPPPSSAPYEVLWNSPWPSECADNPPPRGGNDPSKPVDPLPNWTSFGILTNNKSEAEYNGESVATLYAHDTGLYPEILGTCGPEGPNTDYNCSVGPDGTPRTPVNGGIPQLLNLTAHLDKWAADIVRILPDPNWSGVANLDWEAWNPDWEVNGFAEYQIYQNRSIELVLSQHPSWTVDEATPVAKVQFETSAKALWLETLALAKALRPHGKWGWYNFAHCMSGCSMVPLHGNSDSLDKPLGSCKPAATASLDYNTRMMWLYTEVTALFPSIYLPCPPPSHHAASVPEWCTASTPGRKWTSSMRNMASVDCQMDAARYTAAAVETVTGVRPEIFAFGWMDYYPPNDNLPTGLFLSAEDASLEFARPALWGAAGSIVWGASEDTFNNSQCNGPKSLGAYLNSTAGSKIHSAIEDAAKCAADRCHGHGRCVSLPTKHCDCNLGFLERIDCGPTKPDQRPKTDEGERNQSIRINFGVRQLLLKTDDMPSLQRTAKARVVKGCTHNLTQPRFAVHHAVPGAGWLQGDWTSVAFASGTASMSLSFNQTGMPALAVSIQQTNGNILLKSAPIQPHGLTVLNFSLDSVKEGEYPVKIIPDRVSLERGWCGYMPRVLRKQLAPAVPTPPPILPLRVGQPVAMFDDYFISSRSGTLRRLNPPMQRRVSNESWVSSMPPYMWQQPSRGLELSTDGRLSFNMAINFAAGPGTASNEPKADLGALQYQCTLELGSEKAPWHCVNSSKQPQTDNTVVNSQATAPAAAAWPPAEASHWPLKDTNVRYYTPADGPVDVAAMSVHYTGYGKSPTVYPRLSLLQMSTFPIWQRSIGGQKETLVLPVDGVNGRPLTRSVTLSAQSPHRSTNTKTNAKICRDINNCRCDGDNVSTITILSLFSVRFVLIECFYTQITDIHCANDNFGGQWLLPPDGATRNLSFVYSQGRIISAVAPQAAGYDNLAEVRRILVTWSTSDGLAWTQRWWGGGDPTVPANPVRAVPEQYGADVWCYEAGLSPRAACRHATGKYDGSPLLAWVMPYDAERQQFWEDLAFSTDGVTFSAVQQEGGAPIAAVPNGAVGEWNGGLLMGISSGLPDASAGVTHALLNYANSGFHFMGEFRGISGNFGEFE